MSGRVSSAGFGISPSDPGPPTHTHVRPRRGQKRGGQGQGVTKSEERVAEVGVFVGGAHVKRRRLDGHGARAREERHDRVGELAAHEKRLAEVAGQQRRARRRHRAIT